MDTGIAEGGSGLASGKTSSDDQSQPVATPGDFSAPDDTAQFHSGVTDENGGGKRPTRASVRRVTIFIFPCVRWFAI